MLPTPKELDRLAKIVEQVCRLRGLPMQSNERLSIARRLVEAFCECPLTVFDIAHELAIGAHVSGRRLIGRPLNKVSPLD